MGPCQQGEPPKGKVGLRTVEPKFQASKGSYWRGMFPEKHPTFPEPQGLWLSSQKSPHGASVRSSGCPRPPGRTGGPVLLLGQGGVSAFTNAVLAFIIMSIHTNPHRTGRMGESPKKERVVVQTP